jgi:hypothetical protein
LSRSKLLIIDIRILNDLTTTATSIHNRDAGLYNFTGVRVMSTIEDKLSAKGDPMPNTVAAWERLYGLAERRLSSG